MAFHCFCNIVKSSFAGLLPRLICCVLFGTATNWASAQEDWDGSSVEPAAPAVVDNSMRNLRIVFIDHEPSLPSDDVIAHIRRLRTQALENGNSLILYMPNNQNPFVALVNINDGNDERATEDAFGRFCYALNLPSHNKDAWFDRRNFIELMQEFKVFKDNYDLGYATVRMEFFLTSEFWQLGYNKTLLAPIYFALNVPELLKKEFNFDVYYNPANPPQYEKGKPFGELNLGGINSLSLYEFDF